MNVNYIINNTLNLSEQINISHYKLKIPVTQGASQATGIYFLTTNPID